MKKYIDNISSMPRMKTKKNRNKRKKKNKTKKKRMKKVAVHLEKRTMYLIIPVILNQN